MNDTGLVSIPMGTNVLVGAPSAAPPSQSLQLLREGIADVPGLAEVHLPLVFAKELSPSPQLLLAVFPTGAVALDQLQGAVAQAMSRDPWSTALPMTFVTDPALMDRIRASAVQVFPRLSPEWATRKPRRDTASRRMALAIIVTLLVLLAWELLKR